MPALQPVDRLEFQILIDNVTDSLSTAPPNVTLEWPALMRAGMRQLSGRCQCCANHGLALIVKAFRGTESRMILFDAGPVEFAVEYNGSRLGIDFASIDAVVLSHGHWDHAGGLPMAFETYYQSKRRPRDSLLSAPRHVPPARIAAPGRRIASNPRDTLA